MSENIYNAMQQDNFYHRLLDGVMSNLLDGIITIDANGAVLSVNPAVQAMTGYPAKELVGRNVEMLINEHITGQRHGYLHKSQYDVAGTSRCLHFHRKDGSFFLAEIAMSTMQLDDEIIFIASIYDITERVKQEEKIRELARFPEETWSPVLKISSDGIITYTNSRCGPILDSWQTKLHGHVPVHIARLVERTIRHKNSQSLEVVCRDDLHFAVLFAPVPDLQSVYVYGHDITQEKNNYQELLVHRNQLEELVMARTNESTVARLEAERANQAKSIFLANMSHEIRTPLSSLIGYAETLLDDVQSPDEIKKTAKIIIRSSHHLKDIVNDILDISKIEADKLELEHLPTNIFDVSSVIHSLMDKQAREKGLQFNIEYRFPLPEEIITDPVRLKQILLNLCSNAIKFTEHGSVLVKISYQPDKQIILYEVADTGIGLTVLEQYKIFDAFVQAEAATARKYGGTGLGLALSKKLSLMLGGDLKVESESGKGSLFTLSLPVKTNNEIKLVYANCADDAAKANNKLSIPANLQGKVLLADDTPELKLLIANYIRKTGLEVAEVENGEQAVEAALNGDFEIVFMDIQMLVMDGCTAVKTLRNRGYNKTIIAMTANTMPEERERCLVAGCNDFIGKPIQRDLLYEILLRYLQNTSGKQKIVSSLFENEPELAGLVGIFLKLLPDYLQQCHVAMQSNNWEALAHVLHTLKGMGGSYGFQIITDTAIAAENKLKEHDYPALKSMLEKLAELNEFAQRDFDHKIG